MHTLTKCVPCAKGGLDSFMLGQIPTHVYFIVFQMVLVILEVRISLYALTPNKVGANTYMITLSAITPIPKASTDTSEPSSAKLMMDNDASMGVIARLTSSRNAGYSLSKSAIGGDIV